MNVSVSIGEAIDKLSILELKLLKITDESKRTEIQKEINALSECKKYKEYDLYYQLLMYVNEKIWDMTDTIKNLTVNDPNFALISNQIFEFNQKRFRIKNWYNLICNSNIKEQKSYLVSNTVIIITDKDIFYKKISEIVFLALECDCITIVSEFNDIISQIIKIPTISYSNVQDNSVSNVIYLENFEVDDKTLLHFFELKPLVYVSGGLLGDFFHQLSVINELFLNTGRKGILYIGNDIGGENFKYDLNKTYQDTYRLITEQKYIKEYSIFNNQENNINLSNWRCSNLLWIHNWHTIFSNTYNIEWGKNKWLDVPIDTAWNDTILFSTTLYRTTFYRPIKNLHDEHFEELFLKYGKRIKFMDLDPEQTNIFNEKYGCFAIDIFKPSNLYEAVVAINSCKIFIGNLSSPLAIAYCLHKKCVVGLSNLIDDGHHFGLEEIMPNITINTNGDLLMEEIKKLVN
jgi:hypothetical protein